MASKKLLLARGTNASTGGYAVFNMDDLWRIIEDEGLDIVEVIDAIKAYSRIKKKKIAEKKLVDAGSQEPINNMFNYESIKRLEKKGVKH